MSPESRAVFLEITGIVRLSTYPENSAGESVQDLKENKALNLMEVVVLIPRGVFLHSQQTRVEIQLFQLGRMQQEAVELKGHGVEALGSAVRGSVFISCRYFHVCGLLSFWETTQRKRSETLEPGEHRPGWRPCKLIRHCIFDNWLAYLKNNPALSRCVNKLLRPSGRAETLLQRKVSALAESVLHAVEW